MLGREQSVFEGIPLQRQICHALALAATLALGSIAPAAGGGSIDQTVLYVSHASSTGVSPAAETAAVPRACDDRAYNLAGGRWTRTLGWYFRSSSTPAGLGSTAALTTIKRSFSNIVSARNDCGRPDRVGASARYLGTTSAKASCRIRDGRNVVAFRSLPSDVLARTCWWVSSGRIVEADIQINNIFAWATSLSSCSLDPMLEAVMTHEIGHAFGVGHVSELTHGRLTMSTHLDGPCNNQEATLGLGDVLALERLY